MGRQLDLAAETVRQLDAGRLTCIRNVRQWLCGMALEAAAAAAGNMFLWASMQGAL